MKRLLGGLLIGAGMLIMATSGLCTFFVVTLGGVAALEAPWLIFVPIVCGGIPFLVGFGLVKLGRSIRRESDHNVF